MRDFGFGAFGFEEGKRQRGEKSERQGREDRMKISAMEGEVGGRAQVAAKKVYVGNHAGQDDRDCGATGGAREGSALNRIRGQGVGERVHTGEVISQKHSLSRRF